MTQSGTAVLYAVHAAFREYVGELRSLAMHAADVQKLSDREKIKIEAYILAIKEQADHLATELVEVEGPWHQL